MELGDPFGVAGRIGEGSWRCSGGDRSDLSMGGSLDNGGEGGLLCWVALGEGSSALEDAGLVGPREREALCIVRRKSSMGGDGFWVMDLPLWSGMGEAGASGSLLGLPVGGVEGVGLPMLAVREAVGGGLVGTRS